MNEEVKKQIEEVFGEVFTGLEKEATSRYIESLKLRIEILEAENEFLKEQNAAYRKQATELKTRIAGIEAG